jgi:hypothetical protein
MPFRDILGRHAIAQKKSYQAMPIFFRQNTGAESLMYELFYFTVVERRPETGL